MSAEIDRDEDESGGSFLAHLPAIIKQRRWFLVIPSIIGMLGGIAAAFLMPTVYRSSAVLLVESPQLTIDTNTQTTDIIDQRIAKIQQQVLSRPDLIEMIQRFGLYTDERNSKPLSEIVETMRSAAMVAPVDAQIQQSNNGRSTTIAFSMSFDYSDPVKAQAVAQELTERVLEIDSTKNAEQAENTVQFLTDQATGLQAQISQMEMQISGIKARNGSALSSTGMTMLGMSGGSYDAQIAQLQRDNAQLNGQRALAGTAANRDPAVSQAEAALAAARAVYSETHPDVIVAKQRLAEAKELGKRNVGNLPADSTASQIAFNNSQIAALQAARAREAAQASTILGAQSRAPVIMEQVAQLQQKLEGVNAQYQGVSAKLLAAQANAKMENEQKGERLSVIDPPVVPDKPSSPNRPVLIAGGYAAGLGLGLALILGLELLFKPVRGVDSVRAIVGAFPLVAIPTIVPAVADRAPWYRRLWPFGRKSAVST
ncbi:GumC family protein [Sphingobium boeckii]|uniref:Uncharacterized protein involved in exopolysaccharide biosynthesis n=1 Tax=Sphingobium boeckii TaxID=1082345 RepID=A0A7W9AJK4_9SPHN|nr:Wzz/FepE/Etk N-terminal domain-containing protein [Sphingobium boeckii]MBB5686622.1 uncharacterized protein involved in exopolysaccharide biosynthesis [Sphingobium boeckii]